jgi:pimeloyl-ACP methyl ester carboxylesterase
LPFYSVYPAFCLVVEEIQLYECDRPLDKELEALELKHIFVNLFEEAEASVTTSLHWRQLVGNRRDWVWRGWQTHYTYVRATESNSSTPLLLLHGFGASIGHWRYNLNELGQYHTVYALDLLGFGASEKPIATYNINLWVEQVYEFWRSLIGQPVVLVGNSIGSLVCLAAASAYPEMVGGIVMLSLPDLSVEQEAMPPFLRPVVASIKGLLLSPILLKTLFPLIRCSSFVRAWASIAYAKPTAVTEELVEILVEPAHDRGSAGAFAAIFRSVTDVRYSPHIKTVLPTLRVPMLLVWGEQDRMIPKNLAHPEQYKDYNPLLTLVELEGAGHCPQDEHPETVNRLILDWIDSWQM